MKIAAAQVKAIPGNIEANINHHVEVVRSAAIQKADIIIFPELSLTGYEPKLAAELAIKKENARLTVLQTVSDKYKITIGVGAPVQTVNGVCIGMILFQPQQQNIIYYKKYLHADEEPYFIGCENEFLAIDKTAFAICYELSVPQHAEDAFKTGANTYVVSVAKTLSGMENAAERLSTIATQYSVYAIIANAVGYCDDFECAGASAAWNSKGELLAQLPANKEGLLILDTETEDAAEIFFQDSLTP
jgi:predicted amidohydrolase